VAADPRISEGVREQVGVAIEGGISFVPVDDIAAGLAQAQVPPAEAEALLSTYTEAQLFGLRAALLAAAAIALLSLFVTRELPSRRLAGTPESVQGEQLQGDDNDAEQHRDQGPAPHGSRSGVRPPGGQVAEQAE
jgi:hypothetical protein